MRPNNSSYPSWKELIRLQDSYIDTLVDEMNDIIGEGLAGAWLSKRGPQIRELRDQIKVAKKALGVPVVRRYRKAAA